MLLEATSTEYLQTLASFTEIEKIESLAAHFFTYRQIALYLGYVDVESFRREILYDIDSLKYAAYQRGKLTTEIILRHDALMYSLKGSKQDEANLRMALSDLIISENE